MVTYSPSQQARNLHAWSSIKHRHTRFRCKLTVKHMLMFIATDVAALSTSTIAASHTAVVWIFQALCAMVTKEPQD